MEPVERVVESCRVIRRLPAGVVRGGCRAVLGAFASIVLAVFLCPYRSIADGVQELEAETQEQLLKERDQKRKEMYEQLHDGRLPKDFVVEDRSVDVIVQLSKESRARIHNGELPPVEGTLVHFDSPDTLSRILVVRWGRVQLYPSMIKRLHQGGKWPFLIASVGLGKRDNVCWEGQTELRLSNTNNGGRDTFVLPLRPSEPPPRKVVCKFQTTDGQAPPPKYLRVQWGVEQGSEMGRMTGTNVFSQEPGGIVSCWYPKQAIDRTCYVELDARWLRRWRPDLLPLKQRRWEFKPGDVPEEGLQLCIEALEPPVVVRVSGEHAALDEFIAERSRFILVEHDLPEGVFWGNRPRWNGNGVVKGQRRKRTFKGVEVAEWWVENDSSWMPFVSGELPDESLPDDLRVHRKKKYVFHETYWSEDGTHGISKAVKNIPPGVYWAYAHTRSDVRLSDDCRLVQLDDASVDGGLTTVNLTIKANRLPKRITLTGQVVEPNGRGVEGARVVAVPAIEGVEPRLSATTDEQGRFSIERVRKMALDVEITRREGVQETHWPVQRQLSAAEVGRGENVIVITMHAIPKVTGTVTRTDGRAGSGLFAGLLPLVLPRGGALSPLYRVPTDDNGNFTVYAKNGAGRYALVITENNLSGPTLFREVELGHAETLVSNVIFGDCAQVKFTFNGPIPVVWRQDSWQDISVSIYHKSYPFPDSMAAVGEPDRKGVFRTTLTPGEYILCTKAALGEDRKVILAHCEFVVEPDTIKVERSLEVPGNWRHKAALGAITGTKLRELWHQGSLPWQGNFHNSGEGVP